MPPNENHVMIPKLRFTSHLQEMDKVGRKTYQNKDVKIKFIQETEEEAKTSHPQKTQ